MKKGFTLVELTITVVIISILIGVIFQTYIMISHIAIKTQHERNLHSEMIYVAQTIQNLVDAGDTTLDGYAFSGDLSLTQGIKSHLTLSGSDYSYTFKKVSSGDYLILERYDPITSITDTYTITDPNKVTVNNFYVKLLPYDDQSVYENKMHEGFWMYLDVQIRNYNDRQWWQRISRKMQTFFNIRKYD